MKYQPSAMKKFLNQQMPQHEQYQQKVGDILFNLSPPHFQQPLLLKGVLKKEEEVKNSDY
jgi:hypothetical protein